MSNIELGLVIALVAVVICGVVFGLMAFDRIGDAERHIDNAKHAAEMANSRAWEATHDVIRLSSALGYVKKEATSNVAFVRKD